MTQNWTLAEYLLGFLLYYWFSLGKEGFENWRAVVIEQLKRQLKITSRKPYEQHNCCDLRLPLPLVMNFLASHSHTSFWVSGEVGLSGPWRRTMNISYDGALSDMSSGVVLACDASATSPFGAACVAACGNRASVETLTQPCGAVGSPLPGAVTSTRATTSAARTTTTTTTTTTTSVVLVSVSAVPSATTTASSIAGGVGATTYLASESSTTPTSSPNANSQDGNSNNGTNTTPVIIGVALGAVCILASVVGLLLWRRAARNRASKPSATLNRSVLDQIYTKYDDKRQRPPPVPAVPATAAGTRQTMVDANSIPYAYASYEDDEPARASQYPRSTYQPPAPGPAYGYQQGTEMYPPQQYHVAPQQNMSFSPPNAYGMQSPQVGNQVEPYTVQQVADQNYYAYNNAGGGNPSARAEGHESYYAPPIAARPDYKTSKYESVYSVAPGRQH
ncbi:hypothetical protein BJ742DRAFT_744825 [Cladochytrium replicatum]|nr:hypothetical protein BJ742DRAFT_744825 [Cladochytrium replicatum]